MTLDDFDMTEMEEYPFVGVFYASTTVNEGSPLLEQEETTEVVISVECDVQQASILGNEGFKTTSYNVYFPLPEKEEWEKVRDRFGPISIKRGLYFQCDCFGYHVDGIVEGVGFSMLGGCVVQIKDRTEQ